MKIGTEFFHYSKETFCFSTDISNFDGYNATVINDAIRRKDGFFLISQKTNYKLYFKFDSVDKNIEGEICGWNFVAQTNDVKLKDLTVLIIND